MARDIKTQTCSRCSGEGIIKVYMHVLGGICFRCWGLGVDPRTASELEAWLVRARQEYRRRQAALKAGRGNAAVLRKELALIAKLGKKNRDRLASLQAAYVAGERRARAMAGR